MSLHFRRHGHLPTLLGTGLKQVTVCAHAHTLTDNLTHTKEAAAPTNTYSAPKTSKSKDQISGGGEEGSKVTQGARTRGGGGQDRKSQGPEAAPRWPAAGDPTAL